MNKVPKRKRKKATDFHTNFGYVFRESTQPLYSISADSLWLKTTNVAAPVAAAASAAATIAAQQSIQTQAETVNERSEN